MKTPANKYNKLKNSQSLIEKKDYTENTIKIDGIKHDIIRGLAYEINCDIKDRTSLKTEKKMIKMQIKFVNYDIEDLLRDNKPNLTL